MTNGKKVVTVVLVHGAWADGSSWNRVTEELQRKGFNVVAAQIPLTSFSDDAAVLRKVLQRQEGPVVLAGHSYGGAVITAAAANNSNVKALVYIAAIVHLTAVLKRVFRTYHKRLLQRRSSRTPDIRAKVVTKASNASETLQPTQTPIPGC